MRNLKRALSLTLASVMLLGMMVVGAGAASYPDVDDSDNVEAIEVLQAVKVMVGDENGNFGPEQPVNRSQMAVVMALLLDLDYNYYQSTCPFWDVPSWAEPYVAACYANGIVSGYNATTYGAGDPVTAVQAASMMMRALGYFQYESDYADGFELATVRQASRIQLFAGVDANATDALTRNQVAQLALNALESTMVDASKTSADITVGSGDTAVTISGQVAYIVRTGATNSKMATAIKTSVSGAGTDGTNGQTIELGEQLYNGDLKKTTGEDAFGAPATVWTYKNTEIGRYADATELTYLTEVKLKDIYKDLSLSKELSKTEVKFVIDGEDEGDGITANDGETALNNVTLAGTGTDGDLKLGGKGSVVNVYYDADASVNKAVITVMNYYLAQAEDDYNAGDGELDVAVLDDSVSLDSDTLKLEDIPGIASVREGDYLVVTIADSVIKSAVSPETVSGVQVTAARSGDYVTAGGHKYEYSAVASKESSGALGEDLMNDASLYSMGDKDYNLYLDPNGYVLGVEAVDGEANVGDYLFVTAKAEVGFDDVAKAVFTDGATETITVSKVVNDSGSEITLAVNKFYTFKTTKSGSYELTLVPTDGSKAKQGSTDDARLDNAAQPIRNSGNTAAKVNFSANSGTVFIAKDKAYVGVKNAPETNIPGMVYYVLDKNSRLLVVYTPVQGVNSADADDIVYILDKKPATTTEDGDTYYIYFAVVDGEKTETFASNDNNKAAGLYVVKSYTDGRADLGSAVVTEDGLAINVGKANENVAECKNGTLIVDNGKSYLVADNVKVRTISGTTVKSINASGVKNAVKDGFDQIYVIKTSSSNSEISTIYLVKGAETIAIPSGDADQASIKEALENEDTTEVVAEDANLTNDGNNTSVPANKTLTLTGTAQGTATTVDATESGDEDGAIVLDDVTVAAGETLDLTGASVTGSVTVPDNATLKLGSDAVVKVKTNEGATIEAKKGAKITFDGPQTAPVAVSDASGNISGDLVTAIKDMLPEGGQIDLGNRVNSSDIYNPKWNMVMLVLPACKSYVTEIYNEDGTELLAQSGNEYGDVRNEASTMLIGLTTKPLNEGCFAWAKGNYEDEAGKSVSLTNGTYKYVIYETYINWGSQTAITVGTHTDSNYKEPGTLNDKRAVILEGYFTIDNNPAE